MTGALLLCLLNPGIPPAPTPRPDDRPLAVASLPGAAEGPALDGATEDGGPLPFVLFLGSLALLGGCIWVEVRRG